MKTPHRPGFEPGIYCEVTALTILSPRCHWFIWFHVLHISWGAPWPRGPYIPHNTWLYPFIYCENAVDNQTNNVCLSFVKHPFYDINSIVLWLTNKNVNKGSGKWSKSLRFHWSKATGFWLHRQVTVLAFDLKQESPCWCKYGIVTRCESELYCINENCDFSSNLSHSIHQTLKCSPHVLIEVTSFSVKSMNNVTLCLCELVACQMPPLHREVVLCQRELILISPAVQMNSY